MRKFNIIAAVTGDGIIGVGTSCPHTGDELSRDRKWFREMTRGCSVIMGRRTYESIGKPLKNRLNVVLSQSVEPCTKLVDSVEVIFCNNFNDCVAKAATYGILTWVIGGGEIYALAMEHPMLNAIYINTVSRTVDLATQHSTVDVQPPVITYFPNYTSLCNGVNIVNYPPTVNVYVRLPGENCYVALLKRLLNAPIRQNRTGTPAHCLFAETLRFKLTKPSNMGPVRVMPLLTTKRVPYKMVVAELLWFISGKCTDISYLHKHNVHIWDANTTRMFLDSRGLNYTEGSTGPIYGCQWRNFGGVDQLQNIIDRLRNDPYDRRMIVSAWNPPELDKMALPPCHWSYQFYVHEGALSCSMNMRSADVALGVPFNIASYATLTHIVADIVGLQPGELVVNMADCHLYTDHVEGAREQIKNIPYEFPTLSFPHVESLEECVKLDPDDFKLNNYKCHSAIKYKMAV